MLNGILIETWTIKAVLMTSQMEMRNMFLDSGKKMIIVIKGQNNAGLS